MNSFIESLTEAEREEEVDLYRFQMYLANKDDLNPFSPDERKELETLFHRLVLDTQKHSKLINRLKNMLIGYRNRMMQEGGS